MVEINTHRYFDPRFLQFGLTALILKFIVYYIQSQLNPNTNMALLSNTVVIKKGSSSATIHLFGATLTSWIVNDEELLFVSQESLFDGKKAIRGGIPVVFPHFGTWEDRPQHGFARINMWTVKEDYSIGSESVTLVLEDSESSRKLWNHKFRFEYTVTLLSEDKLKMEASIRNLDDDSMSFTFLLHTYFSVPDVLSCGIKGLKGCAFIDKVNKESSPSATEGRDLVKITSLTDRIYLNTPNVHELSNISGGRTVTIEKQNLPDTVVWNPWVENSQKMSDFGDYEWQKMICIEAGVVNNPVVLNPKDTFAALQILSIKN